MAGFRCLQRGLGGVGVAELADQDDVGSCRSARRRASSNDAVSSPTSRWLTMQLTSSWRISIGSSIVTMCCCRVRLMWSMTAASVVVFPSPCRR